MNPSTTSAAIASLLTTRPAHLEPRKVYFVRPLVVLVVLAAASVAHKALPFIASLKETLP